MMPVTDLGASAAFHDSSRGSSALGTPPASPRDQSWASFMSPRSVAGVVRARTPGHRPITRRPHPGSRDSPLTVEESPPPGHKRRGSTDITPHTRLGHSPPRERARRLCGDGQQTIPRPRTVARLVVPVSVQITALSIRYRPRRGSVLSAVTRLAGLRQAVRGPSPARERGAARPRDSPLERATGIEPA